MKVKIRKALLKDIENIMIVIKEAQRFLAKEGVDQWQDGFPNPDIIKADIENWESFVFEEKGEIFGFFTLALEEDEGYKTVYEGQWLLEGRPYATIHRTAFSDKARGQGLSEKMFDFCENIGKENNVESIRVDTHEDNKRMRHIIEKNNYTYCGHIFLAISGAKRVIYEKLL